MATVFYRPQALETIARRTLNEYDPMYLNGSPRAVPIETIIEKTFGLRIEYQYLTNDARELGRMIYDIFMSKIIWDKTGERLYETGCDHGVLYPMQTGGVYNKGVAWNGLTAVTESPSGAEASPIYADNIKYVNLVSNEEFGATVEAYMYPDEFAIRNGLTITGLKLLPKKQ